MASSEPRHDTTRIVQLADFAGTFVFAVEGAITGTLANLDLFGVSVLSVVTALGGGIIRDLLIGSTPPMAIRDWRYIALCVVAGMMTFLLLPLTHYIPRSLMVTLDAFGLSLFAVAGAQKALAFGIHPVNAALMGVVTGVGGGTMRDILLNHVPTVLTTDIYATAALAGAAVVVIGRRFKFAPQPTAIAGGIFCFALRLVAVWQDWHLPALHRALS